MWVHPCIGVDRDCVGLSRIARYGLTSFVSQILDYLDLSIASYVGELIASLDKRLSVDVWTPVVIGHLLSCHHATL